MTVFVQFAHPRQGFIYCDPRDIIGFRTNLDHDEAASTGKPLILILRNGTTEEVHSVSIAQVIYVRGLMKGYSDDAIIPFENLLDAHPGT